MVKELNNRSSTKDIEEGIADVLSSLQQTEQIAGTQAMSKNVVDAMLSNISEGGKADAGNSGSHASVRKGVNNKKVSIEVLRGDLINKYKRSQSKRSSRAHSSTKNVVKPQ